MTIQASLPTALPLLSKYGFDEPKRQLYLQHFGLTGTDDTLAQLLNEKVILPNAKNIIESFYAFLLALPSMQPFLPAHIIPGLKQTQEEYLHHFAQDLNNPYYFEYRLRIGIAHERVGLPADLYQAANRKMIELIIAAIPHEIQKDIARYFNLIQLIIKVASLDMALAIETYTAAKVATLSESISTLQVQQEELTVEIQRDALTGALSRRYVLENLERMIQNKHRQTDVHFCVAMIDLDHFKKVNDAHGHLVGDRLLHHVTTTMKQSLRNIDILGRYGGEEFLLILPDIDVKKARSIADRIRLNVEKKSYHNESIILPVTISIGLCQYHKGASADQLIQAADTALYKAKHEGRNCIRICE